MDPISHIIGGIALSKAAQPYVNAGNMITTAFVIGSLLPDADIILQRWGDYRYLKNHRGASHSLIGIAAASLFVAAILTSISTNNGFITLFLCCFIGGIGHVTLDIFNSYGVEVLWPLVNKKVTLSSLPIIDPIIIGTLIGYIFSPRKIGLSFIFAGLTYIALRMAMKFAARFKLSKIYKGKHRRIHILPSTTRIFNWHFIIDNKESNIIGEINASLKKIRIFRELPKVEEDLSCKIKDTVILNFFKKFTPLYHISYKKIGGEISEFLLTDMRYFIRNNFLHHATAIFDSENNLLKAFFQPYSIQRKVEIE